MQIKPSPRTASAFSKRVNLRRSGLYMAIADRLREMVQEGELPPGSRIQEQLLCAYFDTSKTPLREALKVLASEGLLIHRQHLGYRVAPVDIDDIEATFQVLHSLEEMAGRQIALHVDVDAVAAIERKHQAMAGYHREGKRTAYFRANQELHQMIVDAAGNPVLTSIYAGLMAKIHRARAVANAAETRWNESLAEHEAIMAALRAKGRRSLHRLLRAHSEHTAEEVLQALRARAEE